MVTIPGFTKKAVKSLSLYAKRVESSLISDLKKSKVFYLENSSNLYNKDLKLNNDLFNEINIPFERITLEYSSTSFMFSENIQGGKCGENRVVSAIRITPETAEKYQKEYNLPKCIRDGFLLTTLIEIKGRGRKGSNWMTYPIKSFISKEKTEELESLSSGIDLIKLESGKDCQFDKLEIPHIALIDNSKIEKEHTKEFEVGVMLNLAVSNTAFISFLLACNCSNIEPTLVSEVNGKISLKNRRNCGSDYFKYYVLLIKKSKSTTKRNNNNTEPVQKQHIRRGHIRILNSEIFKEKGKIIWVDDYMAGSLELGKIEKDYSLIL